MNPQEIFDGLKGKFGEAILEFKGEVLQPWIKIAPDKIEEVCIYLHDENGYEFDFLSCLSGVENRDGTLAVVYHLHSMTRHGGMTCNHKIVLKVMCSKENPHVRSVSGVWGTANWHEREAFDMYGIIFDGHPDLRRILLPDDWEGHPLRKDYKVQEFYNGMKVPY